MKGNSFWEMLGWVALVLNLWGNLLLTKKGVSGWIIRLACNVCWIPYSINTQAWALLLNHVAFMGINIYGWWKWSKDTSINKDYPMDNRDYSNKGAWPPMPRGTKAPPMPPSPPSKDMDPGINLPPMMINIDRSQSIY